MLFFSVKSAQNMSVSATDRQKEGEIRLVLASRVNEKGRDMRNGDYS